MPHQLITPTAAAKLLGVHIDTVARYANDGRIRSQRTPGGHRRYFADDIAALAESLLGEEVTS